MTQLALDFRPDRRPLVVSYGLGVDSTAMLVGMHARGIRPDAILFADTGSEKPETYEYLSVISRWLLSVGFPAIEVVRYRPKRPKNGMYTTIEEQCLVNITLPSLTYGYKKCSQKWKAEPMDKRVRQLFTDELATGQIIRAIGYDAGPKDCRRGKQPDSAEWRWWFPLRDWGWDRDECKRQIAAAGLPVPPKSACFFCPSTKPAELLELADKHPDLALRAVAIEDNAMPNQTKVVGLWRRPCKGTRGATPHPGNWRKYLEQHRPALFADERGRLHLPVAA